jgi:hypothetical protein
MANVTIYTAGGGAYLRARQLLDERKALPLEVKPDNQALTQELVRRGWAVEVNQARPAVVLAEYVTATKGEHRIAFWGDCIATAPVLALAAALQADDPLTPRRNDAGVSS